MVFRKKGFDILANQCGAVLLMVLICVTLLGIMAGICGTSWQTIVQRAKEADLLWKGTQIRHALGQYYEASAAGNATSHIFPSKLNFLTKDPRFLETKRYLRRLYPDPMTGEDWELIKNPAGQIIGVRSISDKEPFKQGGFSKENQNFSDQTSYHDWQFIYKVKKKVVVK